MRAESVLLVGGPADGETMQVPAGEGVHCIGVATPDPALIRKVLCGEVTGEDILSVPATHYHPAFVDALGVTIRVHVAADTPTERVEATLYRVLLSDLAKALVITDEQDPRRQDDT